MKLFHPAYEYIGWILAGWLFYVILADVALGKI